MTWTNRNEVIARASEKQHRINVKQALHYMGLDPRRKPEEYAAEDIYDFAQHLISLVEAPSEEHSQNSPDQLSFDYDNKDIS